MYMKNVNEDFNETQKPNIFKFCVETNNSFSQLPCLT